MASKTRADKFAAKPSDAAEELLEPVLSFLVQAGISETEALRAFKSAWNRSSAGKQAPIQLDSLDDTQPYVDLVTTWSRSAAYLDKQGLPRDLPMRGKVSFASMVKTISPKLDSKKTLLLLQAYGNVEKLKNGRLRLTKPFFHIKSNTKLAFEPSVRFLLDAARNVKASLKDSAGQPGSNFQRCFWRAVDSRALPKARRKDFVEYVRSLSLTFLQDVDDWLSENAAARSNKVPNGRVGLGLFTIGTTPE